jgi:hypothetical protein
MNENNFKSLGLTGIQELNKKEIVVISGGSALKTFVRRLVAELKCGCSDDRITAEDRRMLRMS